MKTSSWSIWFSAARPRTLPAAVAPVIVGTAFAARDDCFDAAAAVLCLGFAVLVQIGTNFANDYYDFVHGADTAARVGPRRAVAAGLVRPETMRKAMWCVFTAAFACGLGLIAWGGPWLLVIGVASILCGIAYTGGPWPLGYNGLGDVFVFVFFGLVAVNATYFVQVGELDADVLIAAVPIGLLAANILVVNNYRDAETDAVAGKRTLVVRFGRRTARIQHAVSLFLALVTPLYFFNADRVAWRLLPLLTMPIAWSHSRRLRQDVLPAQQIELLGATGKLLAIYSVLMAASILL